jgi:hypothetical protein
MKLPEKEFWHVKRNNSTALAAYSTDMSECLIDYMASTVTNPHVARPYHQDMQTWQLAGCESRSVNAEASSSLRRPPVACVPYLCSLLVHTS